MSILFNRFGDYLLEKALASECKQAGLVSASAHLSFICVVVGEKSGCRQGAYVVGGSVRIREWLLPHGLARQSVKCQGNLVLREPWC